MPTLTTALRDEYQRLFDTCQIRPERWQEVNAAAGRMMASQARYQAVSAQTGVPWHVIAVLHQLEASLNFSRHLHNGDPLTARTVQVPAGRPRSGSPPFTWEESAVDALTVDGYTRWSDWSVPGILFTWERYNGWGYRTHHPSVKSPYLWSYTNHYTAGKYVKDGVWSATAVSRQVGAAALMRRLAEIREMDAPSHPADAALAKAMARSTAFVYSPSTRQAGGEELQTFLNRFPGIFLRVDGKLGPRTSDACHQVFGHYLKEK